MKTKSVASIFVATASIILVTEIVWSFSAPIQVHTSPTQNLLWETVYTNSVDLGLYWPADAVSASLEISGMEGTVMSTNVETGVSNVVWQIFSSDKPGMENVYDLLLTFYDSENSVVDVQSSRLAVVKGAFGGIAVNTDISDPEWHKVRGNVVIPYEAGWLEETSDASTSQLVIEKTDRPVQTNSFPASSGYFGWKLYDSEWGYGTFDLALTFPGTEGGWNAVLSRTPGGTIIIVR